MSRIVDDAHHHVYSYMTDFIQRYATLAIGMKVRYKIWSALFMRYATWIITVALSGLLSVAHAQHAVLLQGNDILERVNAEGVVEWKMNWGGIHDIHLLPNGHIMVQESMRKIVEIDPKTKEIVWSYDASTMNGNKGRPLEVHAIQPLANGRIMIAESGPARIIEIDRDGTIQKTIKLKVDHPHPHRDTRLVRKLDSGNYLVCHEGDGMVREYDGTSGAVVWEYAVPMFGKKAKGGHGPEAFGNSVFSALRLPNGNTLIGSGNGHSILEVSPEKKIVWSIHQNDLPDITLAWVTTLEILPNGNLVFGNCHAGPGQPLLIELNRKTKKVVWTFDQFDTYGNSVSNSLLPEYLGKSIR